MSLLLSLLLLLGLTTTLPGESGRVNASILKETRLTMSNVSVGKHFASFGFNNKGVAQLFISPVIPSDAKANLTIAVCTESEMDVLYSLSVKDMCFAKCNSFCK